MKQSSSYFSITFPTVLSVHISFFIDTSNTFSIGIIGDHFSVQDVYAFLSILNGLINHPKSPSLGQCLEHATEAQKIEVLFPVKESAFFLILVQC